MDINDATGIQALLDQLRSSQAWQNVMTDNASQSSESMNGTEAASTTGNSGAEQSSSHPISVASLLSQLQPAIPSYPSVSSEEVPEIFVPPTADLTARPATYEHRMQAEGVRRPTFQQSLSTILQLSSDPKFVETLSSLKQDQNVLERRLWDERNAIIKKYEEKIKVAATKAKMIGSGLSKHEANMLSGAFKNEMKRFDLERALPAWDGLVAKQQETLAQLGVPAMFSTAEQADRERQRRVMQVLDGLL